MSTVILDQNGPTGPQNVDVYTLVKHSLADSDPAYRNLVEEAHVEAAHVRAVVDAGGVILIADKPVLVNLVGVPTTSHADYHYYREIDDISQHENAGPLKGTFDPRRPVNGSPLYVRFLGDVRDALWATWLTGDAEAVKEFVRNQLRVTP